VLHAPFKTYPGSVTRLISGVAYRTRGGRTVAAATVLTCRRLTVTQRARVRSLRQWLGVHRSRDRGLMPVQPHRLVSAPLVAICVLDDLRRLVDLGLQPSEIPFDPPPRSSSAVSLSLISIKTNEEQDALSKAEVQIPAFALLPADWPVPARIAARQVSGAVGGCVRCEVCP